MKLILNEESLRPFFSRADVKCSMERFLELLLHIRKYATEDAKHLEEHDRLEASFLYDSTVFYKRLMDDNAFYRLICVVLDRDECREMLSWFDRGENLDELAEADLSAASAGSWAWEWRRLLEEHKSQPNTSAMSLFGRGVSLAARCKRCVVSVDTEAHRVKGPAEQGVLSIGRRAGWNEHLNELASLYCIRRVYENPGHHDPTSAQFRGGGSQTSILPHHADELYLKALPEDREAKTWWAIDDAGVYHRFQEHRPLHVHWNGSTRGERCIRLEQIPVSVRKALRPPV